jgi:methylmalonyl-CoA mutase N-terminal domain/subunit
MPALGLGLGLALSSGIRRLDPDAAAYIAAVQAAGGTVTATQSGAINSFIRVG